MVMGGGWDFIKRGRRREEGGRREECKLCDEVVARMGDFCFRKKCQKTVQKTKNKEKICTGCVKHLYRGALS